MGEILSRSIRRGERLQGSVKFQRFGEQYVEPFWCLVSLTASTTYPGKVYVSIYRICMHDTERMHACPVRQVGEWSLKSRGGSFYFLDQNKGEMLSISHLYQPWLMSHTADISTRPARFTTIRLRSNSQICSYGCINTTNYKKGSMIWRRVRKTREDNSFPYDLHGLPQTDVGLVRDYPYSMLQGKSALSSHKAWMHQLAVLDHTVNVARKLTPLLETDWQLYLVASQHTTTNSIPSC